MGEEAYDEFDLTSVDAGAPRDTRTLVLRGGYGRAEVYLGICRSAEEHPDELIAVDGQTLLRLLQTMLIGQYRR
jgi:hypothetical protein